MADVLETADRLFTGAIDPADHHPFSQFGDLAEISSTTAFVAAFANAAAFSTDAGLLVVDTSSPFLCEKVHDALRTWSPDRLDTAVFTHGHIDHCFGVELYEADAAQNGSAAPRVIAHEAITARFARYVETAGYNGIINQRQFRTAKPFWPTEYRYPDETYRTRLDIEVGGERFELHHARGETDDHTWVWAPDRKVLCTGDLFIWASPNCGNPQKAQRYAIEWARALQTMADLEPEVLLPGHGLPIIGADRVRAALTDTAALLEHLHTETIKMMNEGARLDDIVHTVTAPAEPARQAVPPTDLRRARVRGPQRLAPVRRLVRRQPRAPQARARSRARASSRSWPVARRGWPRAPSRWPTTASSVSPVTSRSSPRWPHPTTRSCTGLGPT